MFMPRASATTPSPPAASHMRRLVHQLRTEGGTPAREAIAVGLGVFVGCSPWYGLHFAICWGLGWLLRLNRLKMYLAANISNPLVAPFLILGELQTGAWIRRGVPHALTLDTVRTTDPWTFGADLVVGSVGRGRGARNRARVRDLAEYAGARSRSGVRSARDARGGPLPGDQHHRLGIRPRQDARRPAISDGADPGAARVRAARSSTSAAARA